jgi:pimeloyl-ACP methyl ester carboxylesterase
VGVADNCAPSRNPRTERDSKYLNAWLREGFVVVATDYEGLGAGGRHLYLHARAEAFAILDSVRAVLHGMPDVSNSVILLGQSQGGAAVFATAGYAPAYAPELNIRGAVATGAPYFGRKNPEVFPSDQVNPTLAYAMYVVRTAQVFNPDFKDADVFTSRALPVYPESSRLCIWQLEKAVVEAGLTTANSLVPGGMEKAWAQVGKSLAYPTLKLDQPLFMGTGEHDMDVSAEQQIALCNDARLAGARVVQRVYPGLDHSGTVNASLVDSIPFVRQVLAGQPMDAQCQTPVPAAATPRLGGSYLINETVFCPTTASDIGAITKPGSIRQTIGEVAVTPSTPDGISGTMTFRELNQVGNIVILNGEGAFASEASTGGGAYSLSGTTLTVTLTGQSAETYTAYPGQASATGVVQDLFALRLDGGCSDEMIVRAR